jgi:DNA-binding LacI/PurR family transcriptional regulator
VQTAARALGYVPDPALAALVDHRRGLRTSRYTESLALISPEHTLAESGRLPHRRFLIELLRKHASRLGYQLDFFHLPAEPRRQQELVRILRRRRIRGLVFLPSSPPAETFPFPWEEFAAVRLFRPPPDSRITSVDADCHQGAHLIARRVMSSGYTRVGVVEPEWLSRLGGQDWGRFLGLFASEKRAFEVLPAFTFQGELASGAALPAFSTWLERNRPDTVVAFGAKRVQQALARLGRRVPEDVGLIELDNDLEFEAERGFAGLCQSRVRICQTAIDYLHGLLTTNSMGLPTYPATVQVAFGWTDGTSIRTAARD